MNNPYLEEEDEEFMPPEFHRNEDLDETGVSQVLVERFVKYRMRYLLKMESEVSSGMCLNDGEIELLSRIVERAQHFNHFVYEFPEYKELVAKVVDLIGEITDKAVENAQENK